MSRHPEAAARFIADSERMAWHDRAIWAARQKRDTASHAIEEWEQLRSWASDIKEHTLSHLDRYLVEFEQQAKINGVQVHWAATADDHNRIVLKILQENQARHLVKSKSMLTEECHLNPYLQRKGIEVIDTDLGERIVQLREEIPSHIVTPAIHLKKEDVGKLFEEKLHTEPGNADPTYLTREARKHLRGHFLACDAALTGVNFAIAETGTVVVVTNEGNSDLGVHLGKVQIHSMGIEKLIPKWQDLGIFTRLLARSATGQPISIYTSHYTKPRADAPMHIILVDNGRTDQLAREHFRKSLACIRCGACMNTCPIYRRSGGHSYGSTIPGPIGSILTPGRDLKTYSPLPFASTLCGSCSDVCPVKIDIHQQLYRWRQIIAEENLLPKFKTIPMNIAGRILANTRRYDRLGRMARWWLLRLPGWMVNGRWNPWGKHRDLPDAPRDSFKEWYAKNRRHGS
ncbi:MAG: lactate utilization protein B [Saprospiraceae bacterium]